MHRLLLLTAFAVAPVAVATDGPDPAFGTGGFASFAFQPVAGDTADHAFVACAGPAGTLNVVGSASNHRRVVVLRLLANGTRDPSFGINGALSIDVSGQVGNPMAAGACTNDGDLVVARSVASAGEENIQVLRIDGTTGTLDPAFDGDGIVAIDLDMLRAGLGRLERPLGVDIGDDGDLLVTGIAGVDATTALGFLLRVQPDGVLDTAAFLGGATGTLTYTSGAYDRSGATTWIVGARAENVPGLFRATLDRSTRVVSNEQTAAQIADPFFALSRVRAVGPGVLVAAFARGSTNVTKQPGLIVFRDAATSFLALPPTPSIDGAPTGVANTDQQMHLAPLGNGALLVAANVARADVPSAFYASRVTLGATAAADRVDGWFGTGGSIAFAQPASGGCATRPNQFASRLTLWNERPVLVGARVDTCSPFDTDYLVVRLTAAATFRDDFE